MKKILSIIIIPAICSLLVVFSIEQFIMKPLKNELQNTSFSYTQANMSVVKIESFVRTKQGITPYLGTGFIVSNKHIITVNHVVQNAVFIVIVTHDNKRILATPIASSDQHDFAVIESALSLDDYPKLKLNHNHSIGDRVYAIGYPYGYERLLTDGVISGYNQKLETFYLKRILASTPLLQGNSGGPLFDKNGNVVGMALAIITKVNSTTSLNVFMSASDITKLYNRVLNNKSIEQKITQSIGYAPITQDKGDYFIFNGIKITKDVELFKLKENDIVLYINDVEIKTDTDFVNTLYYLFTDDPLKIVVLRNSEKITIDIP